MRIEKARRYDLGELRKATRTPQGFLMAPGFATRTGVFPYRMANGEMRYELRHPDDVMDPVSMDTLKNAPYTLEHPPEMVTPRNVAKYRKGHTTDRVEVNRDMLDVDVIIEDEDAISAVEDGLLELSSGYEADIVEEIGVFNGTPYNFRQKNIRYNHLAGVKRGRAGPEVRLRLDSADAMMVQPPANVFSQETSGDATQIIQDSEQSKKVVISGKEVDLPSDVADTVQDMLDRYDEMRVKQSQLEEAIMAKRTDVDVSQPGVSPQVKVEQPIPDGRSAPAKAGAGDKGGVAAAKGDEEGDDKKKDGEEEKKDFEAGNSAAGGGAAKSPVDQLKKDMEEMKKDYAAKMDSMQGKIDEAAAASMSKGEKKPDAKNDSADDKETVRKQIRARVALERSAEKLVPFEVAKKFDSMTDEQVRVAVIKHRHPGAQLEGKSSAYIESRFDSITETLEEESSSSLRKDAGRAMLGLVGGGKERTDAAESEPDPAQARLKMISASRELYKANLSASKK